MTVRVVDENGWTWPQANNRLSFDIQGPGEIVATDNGDPTDMSSFASYKRKAFNGLCLVIIRAKAGETAIIQLSVKSESLTNVEETLISSRWNASSKQ